MYTIRYQQEIQSWDEIEADKAKVVEESKKTFDAERDVDFSQLHTDDVETLRTYLTPSQLAILQQPLPDSHTSEHLEAIVSLVLGGSTELATGLVSSLGPGERHTHN